MVGGGAQRVPIGAPDGRAMPDWWVEFQATFRLAWPLVLTQLAAIGMDSTDVLMMGWLGPEHLAAGTLSANLIFPLNFFSIGVLAATAAMFAQERGARQFRAVRRTARQGFWIILTLFLPMIPFLWYGEQVLLLFGQDPATADLARGYLRAALWGNLPFLGFMLMRNFLAAHDRPRVAAVVTVVAILVNGLLDYVLMFGNFGFPRLELVGAGIATSVVKCIMFATLLGVALADKRLNRYRLLRRFWRADWPRYREILSIGVPIGTTVLAEAGLFSAVGILIGLFGINALAAHAVALQLTAISFMIPLGISQAATVRVGLAVGERRPERIAMAGWSSVLIGLGFMISSAVAFIVIPEPLIALFLGTRDAGNDQVFGFAISFLMVAAAFQLVDGLQVIALGALRGMKDTRLPMLVAVIGYWPIGFGSAVLLGFHIQLGPRGVWIGLALALAVVAVALSWRFHVQSRRAVSR